MSDEEQKNNDANLEFHKYKRNFLRMEVTKNKNKIDAEIEFLSTEEKLQLLERCDEISAELEDLNSKIFRSIFLAQHSESATQTEYDLCVEYKKRISLSITKLNESLPETERKTNQNQYKEDIGRSTLKLPHLPLPEYGHKDGEDLGRFLKNFKHLISKYSLSEYEKYIYLQRQLSNEPLTLVKSLELGQQNYSSAKELLQKAIASTVVQQYKIIKQLSEMKLTNTGDPYEYISNIRMIMEPFNTLEINSDIILQFFFWNGLNDKIKEIFIQIANQNNPLLEEIKKSMFDATERYLSGKKNKFKDAQLWVDYDSEINRASAAAAMVKVAKSKKKQLKGLYCNMCTGKGIKVDSHSSFNCPIYKTAEHKRERGSSLNGCVKCVKFTHISAECKQEFKRSCSKCGKFHYAFHCLAKNSSEKKNPNKDKTKSQEVSVQSGSLFVGKISLEQYGEDAIVPTFSVGMGNGHKLRCMRDSGCQTNFITNDCADKLKLKEICSDFPITVNGFNKAERHITRVVELKLNQNQPPITAICVPKINIDLKLPGLSEVVEQFVSKGFRLADEFLLLGKDYIYGIDAVIGNNDAHVLPQHDVAFGSASASIYSDSPVGIMLMGGVKRILKNIEKLPLANSYSVANCLVT